MKLTGVVIICLLLSSTVLSSTDTTYQNSEPFDLITEEESASFIEYITDFFSTGIDINQAEKDDFLELPGFDEETAGKIVAYRSSNSRFYSTGELYIIPGINPDIIRKYYSLFKVDSRESSRNNLKGNFSFRQEKRLNQIQPLSYPGDEYKMRMKSELRYGETLTARIITEKDPGELKFADHYTGFLTWKQRGILRSVTLGSYILRSPAGLLSGSPYYITLGSRSLRFTNALQVRGFSSSEENRYLLGGAATIEFDGVTLIPFYSNNLYDGSFGNGAATLFLLDGGYHRSITERRLKDGLLVKSAGISASMNSLRYFRIGLTFYHQDVASASNRSAGNYGSASFSAQVDKYAIMSELVYNRSKLDFVVHAARKSAGNSPAGIYFRNLYDNSLPVYANPYRESSYQNSETGGGFYFRLNPFSVPLDCITDIFSYKKPGDPFTTSGFRILISGEKKLSEASVVRAAYSLRSKDRLINTAQAQQNSTAERHSFSVFHQQSVTPFLNLKNRLIYNLFRSDISAQSDGFAFISEIRYTKEDHYGFIAGYAGFSGGMIETASYFSERSFLDFGTLKPLTGTGSYIYTSLFAALPLNFTLSARAGWENKISYENLTDKNINGSLMILYEW
ncbi:MAG: hypothetical protein AMXMBFR48_09410 [Ignavibacteriales bacterium]